MMNYVIHYTPTGTLSECHSCPFDTIEEAIRMVELIFKEGETECGCTIYNLHTGAAELYFQICNWGTETHWVDAVANYRVKTWEYYFRNRNKIRAKAYQKKLAEVEGRIARAERERAHIKQELEKLGL